MIRRAGPNDKWLLISQVDHAHLSGEVAAVWGHGEVPPLPQAERLVPAIRDHDDGWSEWERAPTIDPATGDPRNFTEMPMPVATAIWTRSIETCRAHSAWGGIWVSRHFTYLGEKARESREPDSEDARALVAFLDEQAALQAAWRADINRSGIADVAQTIEQGFHWVQYFDALSLWLCCAERTDSEATKLPDGGAIALIPRSTAEVVLDPWPLSVERLVLSVPAWSIPARRFTSDIELRTMLSGAPQTTLQWTLCSQT